MEKAPKSQTSAVPPLSLWIHQSVRVKLVNGSILEGFVQSFDPTTHCALLIKKMKEDDGKETWGVSVVMSGSVRECEAIDLGGPEVMSAAVHELPLIATKSEEVVPESSNELLTRRENIADMLREHRVEVTTEGDSLSVMSGLLRLRPPYTAHSCSSSNDVVLKHVTALLQRMDMSSSNATDVWRK